MTQNGERAALSRRGATALDRVLATSGERPIILIRLFVGLVVFFPEGVQKLLFPALLGAGRFQAIGIPLPDFLDYTRATQRVAGVCRLVLHSLIHFLRPEDLFVIGKSHAHTVANRVLIFALKRQNVGQKGFDALVHRVHRLAARQ